MNFLEKALERLWFSCGGQCHNYGDGGASCPLMDGADPCNGCSIPRCGGSVRAALVSASIAVFLLPLATAIGGAFLAGEYLASASVASVGWWQAAGLLAGLAVGVGLAKLVLLLVRSRQAVSGGGDE